MAVRRRAANPRGVVERSPPSALNAAAGEVAKSPPLPLPFLLLLRAAALCIAPFTTASGCLCVVQEEEEEEEGSARKKQRVVLARYRTYTAKPTYTRTPLYIVCDDHNAMMRLAAPGQFSKTTSTLDNIGTPCPLPISC